MTTGRIPNPVPGGTFTDSYGDPRSGGRRHAGVDIFAPLGTPIYSPVSGRVAGAGNDGGYGGNRVWVVGDDGRAYYFAHLAAITANAGDVIQRGLQLGTVGNTGNAASTPPHLHFSVNRAVGPEDPVVNPYSIIDRAMRFDTQAAPVVGSSGSTGPDAGTAAPARQGGIWGSGCLLGVDQGLPLGSLPLVPDDVRFCFLTRGNARAIIGGLSVVAGGVLILAGAFLVVGKASGPRSAVGAVLAIPAQRRNARANDEVADARRSAALASARDRQERAERNIVGRQSTSYRGAGNDTDARDVEPF